MPSAPPAPAAGWRTLVDLLRWRARRQPHRVAYVFLDGPGQRVYTYGWLDRRARAVAAGLQEEAAAGDRALLLYASGPGFVEGFFGCLYAGVVAVPAPPPRGSRGGERLAALAADAGPAVVLAARRSGRGPGEMCSPGGAPIPWLDPEEIAGRRAAAWRQPALAPESLAFLQYTSGSTAAPKGVRVSHRNVLDNEELIRRALGHGESSIHLCWLPLYHDMGLAGNVLQCLYVGAPCVLLEPAAFLDRPLCWLEAVSRHRATTSTAPNFAYERCAGTAAAEEPGGLDLSGWRNAVNGAEPVRRETLERFAAAFAPHGFRCESLRPCYGLAEATVFVTGPGTDLGEVPVLTADRRALEQGRLVERPEGDPRGTALVGSGRPAPGRRLLVVDPASGEPLPPGRVGEVWVAGASVACGYHNRPQETRRVFQARLAGGGEGPFLRTGDLGFLWRGELYLTGRLKDLIVLRGRNLAAEDVERTAEESCPEVRRGGVAAFAVEREGAERLVVVAEVRRRGVDLDEVAARVRAAVARTHQVQPHRVLLLRAGLLSRTTSGKVRRSACRERYLAGTLRPLLSAGLGPAGPRTPRGGGVAPRNRMERILAEVWCQVLGRGEVGVGEDLFALGGDSIECARIAARARERGLEVAPEDLFAHPTVAALAAALADRRTPAHPGLTSSRSGPPDRSEGGPGVPEQPQEPVLAGGDGEIEDAFPLTPVQQGILFHSLDAPASGVYVNQLAVRIAGPLSPAALYGAWQATVDRYPALRTSIDRGGEPLQVVHRAARLTWRELDLGAVAPAAAGELLEGRLEADRRRGFDLARAPLVRCALARLAGGGWLLAWTWHHLVLDGWSAARIVAEVFHRYRAALAGEPPRLAPCGRFRDHVEAVRGWRQPGEEAFWRRRLDGLEATSLLQALAGVAGRSAAPGPHRRCETALGEGETVALERAARHLRVTTATLLQGAWAALLGRWTGEREVIFGLTLACRPAALAGAETIVGPCVNTLPLRVRLEPGARLGGWLRSLQARAAELLRFQASSLTDVRRWSGLPPDRPLFESLLAFESFPAERSPDALVRGTGLRIEGLSRREPTHYPLTLSAVPGRRLELALAWDGGGVDSVIARRLLDQVRALLESLAVLPDRRLGAWSPWRAAELHQVLREWNDTAAAGAVPGGSERSLRLPAEMPEAVAATHRRHAVSYGALARRAHRLAGRLQRLGAGPEARIGICLERSSELLVAVLATLEAGGACLPLDPAYPDERLGWMLRDSGARLVLTAGERLPWVPAGVQVVPVAEGTQATGPAPGGAPSQRGLAYVVYTSGSTGRPKGVAMTRGALANLIAWQARSTWPRPTVLQLASPSFDVFFQELFSTWAAGGKLVLVEEDVRRDPARLRRLLAERAVERIFLPCVALRQLAAAGETALPALRQAITAGEQLQVSPALRRGWSHLAGCRLVNQYGPSESHVVTAHALAGPPETWPALPPIGRPISGSRLYVLDRALDPVPAGAAGELCLAGAGLARGYLGRPGETAARFLPDPFGSEAGGRLYRTGDRVRAGSGGTLEFLERLDDQVKIRGYRVEPGEVEAVLARQAGVEQAVVVVRGASPEDRSLVAYVVPRRGAAPAPEELRDRLARALPAYLVPARFVLLEDLPLTPSGKVDRRRLPAPAPPAAAAPGDVRPARPVAEIVAGIWAHLLEVPRVGPGDSFFALGGHSLSALRVVAHLRRALGVEVPVGWLFEAPILSRFAARVEAELAPGRAPEGPPPPRRRGRPGPGPLSFAQEQLWRQDRLDPGNPSYLLAAALRLRGRLDARALEASLSEVTRRHEALRTTLPQVAGRPVQAVASPGPVRLPVVDLGGLVRRRREGELARRTAALAERGFDLARGPLWRFCLLRLGRREHAWLWSLHHAVTDGWSLGILTREISLLYAGLRGDGSMPALPEPPLTYCDYSRWQRRWVESPEAATLLADWSRRLAGAPGPPPLPLDRPRPALPGHRGALCSFRLPSPLADELESLARRQGATLFMVLAAGFAALLHRVTGERDLVLGTPVAERPWPEVEGVLGLFVNPLPLRFDLSGDPGFRQLLARVREEALAAYAHRLVPFERLLETLAPAASAGRNPLFQVLLALQSVAADRLELAGLRAERIPVPRRGARLDLSVSLAPGAGGLDGEVEYDRDLFDATTIRRLAGAYRRLLAAAAARPETRLAELPLLAAAEVHQLLREWSRGPRAPQEPRSVAESAEARAARAPEAVAVTAPGELLTNGELAARAGRLQARLARLGAGPEVRVGLWGASSPGLVAAALAVVRAGGAYAPFDPEDPPRRVAALLAAAGIDLVLVSPQQAGKLPPGGLRSLLLDAGEREGIPARGPSPAPRPVHPESLVYLIHTSGSAGKARPVAIPHRGLADLVGWHRRTYGVTPASRMALLASPGFDGWSWELWPFLTAGASVHVPPAGTRLDPSALRAWLAGAAITHCSLTTGMAEAVLPGPWSGRLALSWLLVGGDRLTRRPPPGLRFTVVNHYGPTETTVASTAAPVAAAGNGSAPSIGRPLAADRAYVADPGLRPVPVGVAGELCIGGSGLARGYPGLGAGTAERFVPHPWTGTAGRRLYRTGDLARFLATGELEFLGRIDHQVKVRGFRVEPGEVEAALAAHPAVAACAVTVQRGEGGAGGEIRLDAWVVARGGEPPAAGALRHHLRRHLPAYMLPATFTLLERLPLTARGKVDRRALPAPSPEGRERPTAPRTEVEGVVAAILSNLLGLDGVGVDDELADLGGHSLLAVRAVARVREVLGVELPLRAFFEAGTVAGLARAVEAGRRGVETGEPIRQRPEAAAPPLSFAQERLWFLAQWRPQSPAYNVPAAFRLRGRLEVRALARSFTETARRHAALRTAVREDDGRPRQAILPRLRVEPPVIDLSALPGPAGPRRARSLAAAEARRPFDLRRAPLWRVLLVRLAAADHLLVLNAHHLVVDGWSMGVWARELGALYDACAAGGSPRRPEPSLTYGDYAAWQRRWIGSPAAEAQTAYWRRQLAGELPVLRLPADRRRPPLPGDAGGRREGELPGALAGALARLARRREASPFMVLLAALAVLLHRYTGEEDLLVGTPVAGRGRRELEAVVGLFVNTLVLRVDLTGDPTFHDLLERVRETTLEALAQQDLPFERVVAALDPEREPGRQPLFQVMLAFQNLEPPALELAGLELERVGLDTGTAKFDWTLTAEPRPAGMGLSLEYRSDLFDAASAERALGHLAVLLAGAAGEPGRRLGELLVLTPAERAELVEPRRAGGGGRPDPRCLHDLVAEAAAGRRDATAVVCGEVLLSYGELDRASGLLAGRLARWGVGPEERVALLLERSPELVVAILGTLEAGGAYVPLDSAQPAGRIGSMLASCRPRVLLTAGRGPALPDLGAAPPRILDVSGEGPAGEPVGPVLATPATDPAALAYVIYTSGSTGEPKGVAVSHAAAVRLFTSTAPWFRFGPDDVWSLFHSPAFDFSVWELWGALAFGGRLVIVPRRLTRDPGAFLELLVDQRVSVLSQTPSAFAQLAAAAAERPAACGLRLRLVVFGGEALDPASLAPWAGRRGGLRTQRPRLVNMYGITETTVHATYRPLEAADLEGAAGSPIGVPLPDLRIHLLDRRLRPVPTGVAGELAVAGAGLARGYLGRPGWTAGRFVPNPWAGAAGGRLYRSGDLARRRGGGDLEYLGRLDHQVKIRGFRIELGEVEAALAGHAGVRRCAVAALEDPGGALRLVAYAALAPGSGADVGELRHHLEERLPGFMVPSAFVLLERLPLTAGGKVDRRALPAPAWGERPRGGAAFTAPRTPVEAVLAEVWSQVLGVERVGIDDTFFGLGGDSIRSIQVRSRARSRGLDLPLPELFRYPTIRDLAPRLGEAGAGAGEEAAGGRPFALLPAEDRRRLPADVVDAYPLSRLQAGMVFHSEYSPDYRVYAASYHLRAPLDLGALRRAAQAVVDRHPMLRTSFDLRGPGEALQRVHRAARAPFAVVDLSRLPAAARREAVEEWLAAETRRRFDWSRPPLARFTVHLRGDGTFQLTLTEPILDGWSVALLLTELFERYAAALARRPPRLDPPGPATYRDFVALERQSLHSEECRRFWATHLDGCPASPLPAWPVRPPAPGEPAVPRLEVPVPGEVARGLARLAAREGVGLKSVLLAVHLKVTGVLAGRREVVTGLFVNGRPEAAGGDRVLGAFLNTVPLRFRLRPGTWAELAREAHRAEAELWPFRRYPIQEIERLHGGESRFSTAFNFTRFHVYERLVALGLEVLGSGGSEQTYFALTPHFNVHHRTGRIALYLDYRAAEVSPGLARRIAALYRRAMKALALAPDGRHEALCLLTAGERHQLLREWGPGAPAAGDGRSIDDLVAERIARAPEAVAVVFRDAAVSYRQLGHRTAELARRLGRIGVGEEVRVGLCLEPSVERVVGVLGILRAGGAYLPLEPGDPRDRLAFVLRDAGARVVVSDDAGLARLASPPVVVLGSTPEPDPAGGARSDAPGTGDAGGPGRIPRTDPDGLAYVLYTSGSTGEPKGVLVRHRGLIHVIRAAVAGFGVGPGDRVLQRASLGFDASALEIFTALAAGARLCVADRVTAAPGEGLARFLLQRAVTFVAIVPSLLDAVPTAPYRHLRTLVVGGETCTAATARRWAPGRRMFNAYAPTEATIYATAARCGGDDERPPVGRPIPGLEAAVLDADLHPLPAGAAGELYLGGEGIARGYLGRPGLTAERFLPHPDAGAPGERLYRSGDLARHRLDGVLEILGRVDRQVKVRGFRVELGEIEAAAESHPGVREAVAVAWGDEPGARRLGLFFVAAGPQAPAPAALRRFLRRRLPEPMVPGSLTPLAALPRTAHGKVDRRALPHPERRRRRPAPPRDRLEELVAGVWAQSLEVGEVGVDEDFFELGGHSLLATRVVARLRQVCGVELPLRALFEAPTVAGLAARVRTARRGAGAAQEEATVRPSPRRGPAPLSFAQERLWFFDQMEPESALYNVALAVRLSGPLAVPVLERALGAVARRHQVLRSVFLARQGIPRQVAGPRRGGGLARIDLRRLPAAVRVTAARRLAAVEGRRPFDLETGPPWRARLMLVEPGEALLLLTLHHIVTDGWSMGILLRELAALYGAFLDGRPSPLPPLPVQYADYARWQRRWLAGPELERQLAYWQGRLAGVPPFLDLPTDRRRPAVRLYRGARWSFQLPPPLAAALESLSRRRGATLFMTLLAVFQALLARLSGQRRLAVGLPVANRTRTEVEGLIGFFVNTLALPGDLSGEPGFDALVARVREEVLGAQSHQDLPFERLVEALRPPRDLSRPPVFQVMLDVQTFPREPPELPGLALTPLEVDPGTAKFELTLTLAREGDRLAGSLEVDRDLFDATTAERILAGLRQLLAGIAADPAAPVLSLPLLAPPERHQVLVEWDDTAAPGEVEATVDALVGERIAAAPDAVALQCGEERLSYGALGGRAWGLAADLRRRGVGPEARVAVVCGPSTSTPVAMLAVLAAGGAYVPVDPAYPRERAAWMLADSRPSLMLLAGPAGLDGVAPGLPRLPVDRPECARAPIAPHPGPAERAAYVLYTSGSSGRPKGVVVGHRQLVASTRARPAFYRRRVRRFLLLSSFAFDSSVAGIYWTLGDGGTLVIPGPDIRLDPRRIAGRVAELGISHLLGLPSLYALLLDQARPGELVPLAVAVVAGEPCPRELVLRHWSLLPATALYNEYGPTEATVWSHVQRCGRPSPGRPVPVGRPIAGARARVLDRRLGPLPAGVVGELYLGGAGVTRGYLGRPALTAERFLPDPFTGPGERLYRSGDRARHLPAGGIELLGRSDLQVKVRGHRVELEEVEAVLAGCPGVAEAAVAPDGDAAGELRLVAYLVATGASPPGAGELRRFLAPRLPEPMIPALFIPLEALPRTPGGKLDRRALPTPEAPGRPRDTAYRPPGSPLEETVARVWAQVLGIDRVGVDDDFFQLGGHSLAAVRLISRLRAELSLEIPVRRIFEAPTIARLAASLVAAESERRAS